MNIISSEGSRLCLASRPLFGTWDCPIQCGSWRWSSRCRGLRVWTDHRQCPDKWFSDFRVPQAPLGTCDSSNSQAPLQRVLQSTLGDSDAHDMWFTLYYHPKWISYMNLVLSLSPFFPSFLPRCLPFLLPCFFPFFLLRLLLIVFQWSEEITHKYYSLSLSCVYIPCLSNKIVYSLQVDITYAVCLSQTLPWVHSQDWNVRGAPNSFWLLHKKAFWKM